MSVAFQHDAPPRAVVRVEEPEPGGGVRTLGWLIQLPDAYWYAVPARDANDNPLNEFCCDSWPGYEQAQSAILFEIEEDGGR